MQRGKEGQKKKRRDILGRKLQRPDKSNVRSISVRRGFDISHRHRGARRRSRETQKKQVRYLDHSSLLSLAPIKTTGLFLLLPFLHINEWVLARPSTPQLIKTSPISWFVVIWPRVYLTKPWCLSFYFQLTRAFSGSFEPSTYTYADAVAAFPHYYHKVGLANLLRGER